MKPPTPAGPTVRSITVTLPPNSGSFPLQPGTATITVTVSGQTSAPQTITITS